MKEQLATRDNKLHEALKNSFGYDEFRGRQQEVIENLLAGNNTFVIMPTGGGKSLCYQLPALMLDGVALVISPLIALMQNQVEELKKRGIKAATKNRASTNESAQMSDQETKANHISI